MTKEFAERVNYFESEFFKIWTLLTSLPITDCLDFETESLQNELLTSFESEVLNVLFSESEINFLESYFLGCTEDEVLVENMAICQALTMDHPTLNSELMTYIQKNEI